MRIVIVTSEPSSRLLTGMQENVWTGERVSCDIGMQVYTNVTRVRHDQASASRTLIRIRTSRAALRWERIAASARSGSRSTMAVIN